VLEMQDHNTHSLALRTAGLFAADACVARPCFSVVVGCGFELRCDGNGDGM